MLSIASPNSHTQRVELLNEDFYFNTEMLSCSTKSQILINQDNFKIITEAISALATYVIQLGSTGNFQLAVLQPVSQTAANVIAVTSVVTSLTAGLFVLPLTAPVTLLGNTVYYLVAYNQVNGSQLAGRSTGSGTVGNAFPINFRAQNLPVLVVGQSINTSDVSLLLSPYIAGLV